MNRMGLLLAPALLTASIAASEEVVPEPQITVKGEATVRVPPDFVEIEISVLAEGQEVEHLKQDVDDRTAKLIQAAAKFEIAAKDVRSGGVEVSREFRNDRNENEIFKGYALSRDLTIKLRKLESYEPLAQALVDAGANQVDSVEVGVDDELKLKSPALAAAARNAQAKAQAIAEALGIRIGSPLEVAEDRLWYGKRLEQGAGGRSLESIVVTANKAGRTSLAFVPHDVEVRAEVWVRFSIPPAAKP